MRGTLGAIVRKVLANLVALASLTVAISCPLNLIAGQAIPSEKPSAATAEPNPCTSPNGISPKSDRWYAALHSSEWWVVIIAAITASVVCWQSWETRKSAAAALLNAQAVINSERPWIVAVLEAVKGPMGGFNVRVKNKGRTPAMILSAHLGCVVVKNVAALPKEAPGGVGSLLENRIVTPDETVWVVWFDDRTLRNILKTALPDAIEGTQIFVFGRIVYVDLLNAPSGSQHETRWMYLYQRPVGEESDSLIDIEGVGVPDEYVRYT